MYAGVPSTLPACDSLPLPAEPLRTVLTTVSLDRLRAPPRRRRRPRQDLGQAPVHHLHLAERADHHVRGLQVAVDHAPRVRVGHRLADLLEDREEAGRESFVARGSLRFAESSRGQRAAPLTSFIAK